MSGIPGFRYDISGASGSQGLLAPREGWKNYVLPRGGYAAQDSTGTVITFDSASVASRFTVGDWIQVGLLPANIRQVGAVGGNSISISGANLTVTENDRVYIFGQTEPTINGGSATYGSPNTSIRKRDDDGADAYTDSMITTNANGLVQGFAATSVYDVLIQDGNGTNQGSIVDLPVGVAEGISVTDTAYFGGLLSTSGPAVFGATATFNSVAGFTGAATFGTTATVDGWLYSKRGPGAVRYADQFATGSSTGGIQEAHDDLPAQGGHIRLSATTYSYVTPATVTKPNVTIEGTGWGTVLNNNAAGGTTAITVSGDRFKALNFKIMGNHQSGKTAGRGIDITNCNDPEVSGVWISQTPDAAIVGATVSRLHVHGNRCDGIGDAGSVDAFFVLCSAAQNARIYGNLIDGTGTSHSESGNIYLWNGSTGCKVSDNILLYAGNAIRVESARCTISGNYILSPTVDGIRASGSHCVVSGNQIENSAQSAIKSDGGTDNLIVGNVCIGAVNYGIGVGNTPTLLAVWGEPASRWLISNNYVANCGQGIRVAGVTATFKDITIRGNVIRGSSVAVSGHGIYSLFSVSGGVTGGIENLIISNNTVQSNNGDGVDLQGGIYTNVIIRDNDVIGNSRYGIYVGPADGPSTGWVGDNILIGNTAGAQSLSGSSWTINANGYGVTW